MNDGNRAKTTGTVERKSDGTWQQPRQEPGEGNREAARRSIAKSRNSSRQNAVVRAIEDALVDLEDAPQLI
jgi:hypothetical protein